CGAHFEDCGPDTSLYVVASRTGLRRRVLRRYFRRLMPFHVAHGALLIPLVSRISRVSFAFSRFTSSTWLRASPERVRNGPNEIMGQFLGFTCFGQGRIWFVPKNPVRLD